MSEKFFSMFSRIAVPLHQEEFQRDHQVRYFLLLMEEHGDKGRVLCEVLEGLQFNFEHASCVETIGFSSLWFFDQS